MKNKLLLLVVCLLLVGCEGEEEGLVAGQGAWDVVRVYTWGDDSEKVGYICENDGEYRKCEYESDGSLDINGPIQLPEDCGEFIDVITADGTQLGGGPMTMFTVCKKADGKIYQYEWK